MNFYGAKELADSFRTVRKNTIQVAEDIPEGKYSFRAAPDSRSVAELLTHIAVMPSVPERIHGTERLSTLEGFDFFTVVGGLIAKGKEPRTKAQIIDLLRKEGDRFAGWLEGLKDDFLAQRVTYPAGMTPPSKTRFEMIMSAKEHEMHHRGQLMLIERMVGVVPHLTRDMQARIAEMQKAKAGA
jgi:uncharacterized damage-inducible protein DinB